MAALWQSFTDWLGAFLNGFYALYLQLIGQLLGIFFGFVWFLLSWLLGALGYLFKHVSMGFARAFGELMQFVPVPPFLDALQGTWTSIPWANLSYFAGIFEIGYGLTVISTSYVIKFGLRFIPFVGKGFRS